VRRGRHRRRLGVGEARVRQRDVAAAGELQVRGAARILVELEQATERVVVLDRQREQAAQLLHRLGLVALGGALGRIGETVEVVGGGAEAAVDVRDVGAVRAQREAGERGEERQHVGHRHVGALAAEARAAVVERGVDVVVGRDGGGRGAGVARRVLGEAVDQRRDDGAHLDARLQLRARLEHGVERGELKLVREHLNDALHQILLRNDVAAADDLLEQAMQHNVGVQVDVDAVELAEAREVLADEQAQVLALGLALRTLRGGAVVLETHPELVHLGEVLQHKLDRVAHSAAGAGVGRVGVGQLVFGHLGQIGAQKETTRGMLLAAAHLDEVAQHVLGRRLL
jgi:hypothetical protein